MGKFIVADTVIIIIAGGIGAKGEDGTGKPSGDFFIIGDIAAYNEQAVFRQKLCKTAEGGTDIIIPILG